MSYSTHVPQRVLEQAEVIAWTTGLNAITPEALAVHAGLSLAVAQQRLEDLVQLELMEEKPLLVGYSSLYSVTRNGRKFARKHEKAGGYTYPLDITKCRVGIGGARHTIACASAAAALERRYPDYRVIGEQEQRKEEREQAYSLISVPGDGQNSAPKRVHSADLVMWPPAIGAKQSQLPVTVEIELSLKKLWELFILFHAFAECQNIKAVLYFVETKKVQDTLLRVIEKVKAEEKIQVSLLSELVGPLPGFNFPPAEAAE